MVWWSMSSPLQAKKLSMNWLLANGEFLVSKTSIKRPSVAKTSGRRFTSSPLPIIKHRMAQLLYVNPRRYFIWSISNGLQLNIVAAVNPAPPSYWLLECYRQRDGVEMKTPKGWIPVASQYWAVWHLCKVDRSCCVEIFCCDEKIRDILLEGDAVCKSTPLTESEACRALRCANYRRVGTAQNLWTVDRKTPNAPICVGFAFIVLQLWMLIALVFSISAKALEDKS